MPMPEVSDPPVSENEKASEPAVEVFAVYGAEPEIQAYAMAKYSRSALSMKESLKEINTQKAEKFLNTFYFQYGHRSIADLAHIALAIERLTHSRGHCGGRRAALGWPGALYPLSGFQQERLLHAGLQRGRFCQHPLPRDHRSAVYRISVDFRQHLPLLGRDHAQARRDEAGKLRAHASRPRLRHIALPAAAAQPIRPWERSSTPALLRTRFRSCCRSRNRKCAASANC